LVQSSNTTEAAGVANREPAGDGVDQPGGPWRPVLAAFLSALVTGAGQFYARRWWRGLALLAPVVLLGLAAVALRDRGFTYVLELLVQPRVLWAVLIVNVALLGIRGFAVVDAYRLRGGGAAPSWTRAVVALMVVAVAAPHFVAITYSLDAISVIETVFASDELPPIAEREAVLLASGVTEEELGPELITSATFEPRGPLTQEEALGLIPDSDLNPFRPVIIPPEAGFQDAPFVSLEERSGLDRITVLLAGGDAGPGRGGLRTDTMMVATMDLNTGKAAIFSLARNLSRVPLPRGFQNAFREMQISFARKAYDANPPPPTTVTTTPPVEGEPTPEPPPPRRPPFRAPAPCKCFVNQLNALYPFTRNWVRTFPNEVDPGMAALRETLENLLKLRIDYYVLVDMAGFVDLVDAIGGVDVYVEKPMHIAFSAPVEGGEKALINVAAGENHLDGLEALAYVRSRYRSSDYTRMRRQRCMLRSLAAEATPGKLVTSFSAVAAAIRNSATTDIPISFLPDLVSYASQLDLDDIETVAFQPSYYAPTNDFLGHPIPDVKRIRAKVKSVLANVADPTSSVAPEDAECTPRIEGG
jgi:LCP family protein required for cell wall assembly